MALPGTSVSGIKVSGMSRQEIVDLVSSRAQAATVTLTGDVTGSATLSELGATVDAEATADAVMAPNTSVANRFKALFTNARVPVVVRSDTQAVRAYADGLVPTDSALTKNAQVRLADDGTSYVMVPGTSGKALDTDALSQAASQAASTLGTAEVALSFMDKDPDITDADAQAAVTDANSRISQEVRVSSADGQETFTAEPATKASWVRITTDESNTLHVQMDTEAITSWVQEQAAEVKIDPVTGKRNLSPSGQVLAVAVEAVDGSSVSNSEAIAKAIDEAMSGNQPYQGTFEMSEEKATWEERTIAPGAENLPYQAAPGEKWVDINLSAKTLTAYEGATVVRGPEPIVDGMPETPTITGVFHVYLKYEVQTMRGQNADGTPYETKDVPWVTYWHGSYALHGAPWRAGFGYSGSHGCVNLPVGTAHWYYNWTEIGTVVTSHW